MFFFGVCVCVCGGGGGGGLRGGVGGRWGVSGFVSYSILHCYRTFEIFQHLRNRKS